MGCCSRLPSSDASQRGLTIGAKIIPRTRWRWIEVGIYGLVVLGLIGLGISAIGNLRARGIHAGLGFFWDTAGFDIGFALIPGTTPSMWLKPHRLPQLSDSRISCRFLRRPP